MDIKYHSLVIFACCASIRVLRSDYREEHGSCEIRRIINPKLPIPLAVAA